MEKPANSQSLRLRLTDCRFNCTSCDASFSVVLCNAMECSTCGTPTAPRKETQTSRVSVRANYKCTCGREWVHDFPLARRCIVNCGGTALPTPHGHVGPVAGECCGRVCWQLLGRVNDAIECHLCKNHTPAVRLIGETHRHVLAGLFYELRNDGFNVQLADIGDLFVPAAPKPSARRLRAQPVVTANPFDLLVATSSD